MFCLSSSSNLDSFRDGRQVAVELVPCGLLPPGLVQYCSQHYIHIYMIRGCTLPRVCDR